MKKLITGALALAAFLLVLTPPAKAQVGYWGSEDFYSNPRYYSGYNSYRSNRSGYGYSRYSCDRRGGFWNGVGRVAESVLPVVAYAIGERRGVRYGYAEGYEYGYNQNQPPSQSDNWDRHDRDVEERVTVINNIPEMPKSTASYTVAPQKEQTNYDMPDYRFTNADGVVQVIAIQNDTPGKLEVTLLDGEGKTVMYQGKKQQWIMDARESNSNFLLPYPGQRYDFKALTPGADGALHQTRTELHGLEGGGWRVTLAN